MGFFGKKAAAMDPEERLGKTLYTARETGLWLLGKLGTVVPSGLSYPSDGKTVTTFYPRDDHPNAGFEELVDLVVVEMKARARSGAHAVGMVTELESDDGRRAMLVHAEDREQGTVRFMYAIEGSEGAYRLEGEQAIDGSPFPSIFEG
jgi:hypothetical protein